MGFGDGDKFPGYGKLYNREFKVWFCNVGSKEKNNVQIFKDRNPLNYQPNNYEKITGPDVRLDKILDRKKTTFSGLDNKNRKRWYFIEDNHTPTWIETTSKID